MRQVAMAGRAFAVDDDKPTFWDRAEAGAWEPDLLAALAPLTRPGTLFLDIGAWVGPTSLFAAAGGADILALEPDPVAARQFRRNCAANPALASRIDLIDAALTADGEPATFGSPRKQGDSMGSLLLAGQDGARVWTAPGIAPTALAARIDRTRPLVVKIDIEGGEYRLGSTLSQIAHLGPDAVFVGFHPALMLSDDQGGPDALQRATDAIFAAFAGMNATLLGDATGSPAEKALREPVTVRFSQK